MRRPIFSSADVYISRGRTFEYARSPLYMHTDFPWQSSVVNMNSVMGVVGDADLQCMYAEPLRVLHNNILDGYYQDLPEHNTELPTFKWYAGDHRYGVQVPPPNVEMRASLPKGFLELYRARPYGYVPRWGGSVYNDKISVQGITLLWRYEAPDYFNEHPQSIRLFQVRIGVGRGSDMRVYAFEFDGTGCVRVLKDDNGDPVTDNLLEIESRPLPDQMFGMGIFKGIDDGSKDRPEDEEVVEPKFDYSVIDFRLIAGRLSVRIGDMAEPFLYEEARLDREGKPIDRINYISLLYTGAQNLAFSAHPTKFPARAEFDSGEIPIGRHYETYGQGQILLAPDSGEEATVKFIDERTSNAGPIIYYALRFEGPVKGNYEGIPYTDSTKAVRAVTFRFPSIIMSKFGIPWPTTPLRVDIRHTFSFEAMTIRTEATVEWESRKGKMLEESLVPMGVFFSRRGLTPIVIDIWRTGRTGRAGPKMRQFTGYGNIRTVVQGSEGVWRAVVDCTDRIVQFQTPRWLLPWMDGWNVFYAIAYLAQHAGVSLSDIAFRSLVPDDPYRDLGDEDGQPAFFLPIGEAASVLTRFSGENLWDVMTRIAQSIGYLIYFDVYGRLHFRKYRQAVTYFPRRIFFEDDRTSEWYRGYTGPGGEEGMKQVVMTREVGEVRNISIVVGVDMLKPRYAPVVAWAHDPNSWMDPSSPNFLGFENPAVWIDSMFASPSFAKKAAEVMFQTLRAAPVTVTFRTWLQPDLYPLDQIRVISRSLPFLYLTITEIQHVVTKDDSYSVITGRVLPDRKPLP